MWRIAFVGPLSASFAERVRAHLAEPAEFVFTDEADVVAVMPEIDVLVTLVFTDAMGAAATRLRLVQVPGAGLDRIARAALPSGASLANVYGHAAGIAEFVLGAMLALSRRFVALDAALRRGIWDSQWAVGVPPPPVFGELAGKTLGILGYGRIGQALARRARAFDMDVIGVRRDAMPDPHAIVRAPAALPDVLAHADFLAITLPLTDDTRGLIGARELATMKPTAALINVARAAIVDEAALYRALRDGRIAGAALDVWYRYPTVAGPVAPAQQPFHELPNVLMTPHVSRWTDGTLEARATLIAENIGRVSRGEPPLNLIPAR
jgi:phosphoglycerate dehydrogenase-like enzyme